MMISVGIAGLNGLHQRCIVADEVRHFHAGIVGTEGQDHTAGLHLGHGLCDGIMVGIPLKVTMPSFRAAWVPMPLWRRTAGGRSGRCCTGGPCWNRPKKCAVQILGPGVGRLGQQGAGSIIDLIMICKISVCPGLCRRGESPLGHRGVPVFPLRRRVRVMPMVSSARQCGTAQTRTACPCKGVMDCLPGASYDS